MKNTKEVILEMALHTLIERHDTDQFRFSVSARWIPQSLLQLNPNQIIAVTPDGPVERYTNYEVTYAKRTRKRKAQIQLAVGTEQKLPVVTRRITSGEVMNSDDLNWQWVPVAHTREKFVTKMEDLIGKILRRTHLPGQPVAQSAIGRQYLIEAGDMIQLVFEGQSIQVNLTAEAREGGAKGDEISIYSTETRRKYTGIVIGPGVAKWKQTQ